MKRRDLLKGFVVAAPAAIIAKALGTETKFEEAKPETKSESETKNREELEHALRHMEETIYRAAEEQGALWPSLVVEMLRNSATVNDAGKVEVWYDGIKRTPKDTVELLRRDTENFGNLYRITSTLSGRFPGGHGVND